VNQQDVTDAFEIEDRAAAVIDAKHTGDGNFQVKLSDLSGRNDDNLINTIGDYDGQVIASVSPGKYAFEVTYSQEYSLEMVDWGEVQTAPISLSESDGKVIPLEITDPLRVDLKATEKDNVHVSLHNGLGQKVENLANEIGPTETTFMIRQTGQAFLSFDLRGSWEAEITEM
jgi:hypothetical protein